MGLPTNTPSLKRVLIESRPIPPLSRSISEIVNSLGVRDPGETGAREPDISSSVQKSYVTLKSITTLPPSIYSPMLPLQLYRPCDSPLTVTPKELTVDELSVAEPCALPATDSNSTKTSPSNLDSYLLK